MRVYKEDHGVPVGTRRAGHKDRVTPALEKKLRHSNWMSVLVGKCIHYKPNLTMNLI